MLVAVDDLLANSSQVLPYALVGSHLYGLLRFLAELVLPWQEDSIVQAQWPLNAICYMMLLLL